MYIIRRIDQGGGYVAPPGSQSAYTRSPLRARKFRTLEEAERNRCVGNEVIVDYDKLMEKYRH